MGVKALVNCFRNRGIWLVGLTLVVLLGMLMVYTEKRDTGAKSIGVFTHIDTSGMSGKIAEAYKKLHEPDSGTGIKKDYPDVSLVYTDIGRKGSPLFAAHPFYYFYSAEAGKTFGICSKNKSVFICNGKMDHPVTLEDVVKGTCTAAAIVLMRDNDVHMVGQL